MAQLERFFSANFAVTTNDNAVKVVTAFPAIPVNSSILVTGVYFYFTGAYSGNNIAALYVNNGASIPVFTSATGTLINNSVPIIGSNSPFVMQSGNYLEYRFFNTATGNLRINVFYRVIANQNNANALIYGSLKNINVSAPTIFVIPGSGTNVIFIKSLIILNTSATTSFSADFGNIFKQVSAVQNVSSILLGNSEDLFIDPTLQLGVSSVGASTYSYYLSYYYDPLYTP